MDLTFDMSEPPAVVWESIPDFMDALTAPRVCDMTKFMVARLPMKSRTSSTALGIPLGRCDHHWQISHCWICNPCKICPSIKWNELKRPHPRTKRHLVSKIHIESLNKRIAMGKNINGDDDYKPVIEVLAPRVKNRTGEWCKHDRRRRVCKHCNPCSICFDTKAGCAPANSWGHRKSAGHNFQAARRLGYIHG